MPDPVASAAIFPGCGWRALRIRQVKGFVYPERTGGHSPSADGWGTLFNKWEQRIGDAQLTASLRGEWLSTDDRGGRLFDPMDRHIRRPPFSVQDLWLRLPLSNDVDLQLGRFQLAGARPTVILRPMPFFPVI
ncbi:hypothetical protein [Geotalea toluenoxydans]|uniref:hypothetical protein n=1 Tax=Geotalea toluenoxydans TaxID=421624 RepID=UPI000B274644|nr:hypothetical protein [Geotalea toluenoxydans]